MLRRVKKLIRVRLYIATKVGSDTVDSNANSEGMTRRSLVRDMRKDSNSTTVLGSVSRLHEFDKSIKSSKASSASLVHMAPDHWVYDIRLIKRLECIVLQPASLFLDSVLVLSL